VRSELEASFQERAQRALQEKMKERFVDCHSFVVPETLIESALDRFVEKALRSWDGKRDFDEEAVREKNREAAERAARWQVLRARLILEEQLEAREEDFEVEYEKFAQDNATVESVKQDFARQPGLRRKVAERIVERQVLHALARRFEVVEKSREDVLREYYGRLANRLQM
jgi:FKBP-type peptidyl-prolyl cis-trans isomerase (trigger factor)